MKHLSMIKVAQKIGSGALDFILPPRCAACGVRILDHGHLCGACWQELAPIVPPVCDGCGMPFETAIEKDVLCGACLKDRPIFDWARAAVNYEGQGRDLLLKLKHGAAGAVIPVMASMMTNALPAHKNIEIIIPVPLHRRRLLARRFNQSQLLAAAIASRTGVTSDPFLLRRTRATPSQGGQTKKGRWRNVKGAFEVPSTGCSQLAEKSVLLVDDVHTTGATASACALALRAAGAKEIGLLAFARVGGPASG